MEENRDERVKELGMGIIRRSFAEGYTPRELYEAAERIVESIRETAVLHMIIGEKGMEMLADAIRKTDADEVVREAEEVLRDEHQQSND